MAIEVSFRVRDKETKQAFFIEEADWERPLSEVRTLIQQQEISVPLEYKFLTLNGNEIAEPSEHSILLKDVTENQSENENEKKDDGMVDLGVKFVDEDMENKENILPELWIAPLKVMFESSSNIEENLNEENENNEPPSASEPRPQQQSSETPLNASQACACPYTLFREVVRKQANPMTMMKIAFGLTLILFAVLASLTLTMHVMVKALVSINPAMSDILSRLDPSIGDGSTSSEAHTKLMVKLSEIEMAHKYDMDRITTRLAELEDLYLSDLAVHKKELNILKNKMGGAASQDEASYADSMRGEEEEVGAAAEREGKEKYQHKHHHSHKAAKTKGKANKGGDTKRG